VLQGDTMHDETSIRTAIRRFIIETFLLGDAAAMPSDGESFLENGTIDSTGILEVILFFEEHFGVKAQDRELLPENFDSVDNQTRFILKKLNAA
jgi:acyl carrier protein